MALNTNDSNLTNYDKLEFFWEQLEQLAESFGEFDADGGCWLDFLCASRLHTRFDNPCEFLSEVVEHCKTVDQEFASREQLALV